jgi:hypothetical protein
MRIGLCTLCKNLLKARFCTFPRLKSSVRQ